MRVVVGIMFVVEDTVVVGATVVVEDTVVVGAIVVVEDTVVVVVSYICTCFFSEEDGVLRGTGAFVGFAVVVLVWGIMDGCVDVLT